MREAREVKGYNAGAMLLHWAIAIGILFQLVIGFAMSRLDILPDGIRFAVFQWHKTVGLLILTLTVARIAWRLLNSPPAHAPMSRAEAAAAGLVHALFYALMLLVPLTGWLLVSTSPTAIPTLLFLSPNLVWPNLPVPQSWHGGGVEEIAETLHVWLAYSTAALLVLHVAGAVKHSVVDRAPSFSRMVPTGRLPRQSTSLLAIPLAAGLAAVFLGGGLASGAQPGARGGTTSTASAPSASPAGVAGWVVDKAASSLAFETSFSGKPLTGTVGRWEAAIEFDPESLATASAKVTIDPAAITVEDPFVAGSLGGPDGFDTENHPTLTVTLDRFEKTGETYLGHGSATVRDKTAPFDLVFTFDGSTPGAAHVTGTAVLDRIALGLGLTNDPTAQWLGKDVTVRLDLRATKPAEAPGA